MSRVEVRVSLELPPGTTAEDAADYVGDAVFSWKGGLAPDDPFFDLEVSSVVTEVVAATGPGTGGKVLRLPRGRGGY